MPNFLYNLTLKFKSRTVPGEVTIREASVGALQAPCGTFFMGGIIMEKEQFEKALSKLYSVSSILRQLGQLDLTADGRLSIGLGHLLADLHDELQRAVWQEAFHEKPPSQGPSKE